MLFLLEENHNLVQKTYQWTTKPVIIFNFFFLFFVLFQVFVTCSRLIQDQIFKVSPFSELLHNGQKENVTRVILRTGTKVRWWLLGFFRTAAQPCIKWAGEQACNLINALKMVKMDNERAKSQMARSVCLLGTLTAYWSAKESLGQGQSSVMAQILLVGQVQDSNKQDLFGNRSTLEPIALSFYWSSDVLLSAGTHSSLCGDGWDFFYNIILNNNRNLSVVWNWCDVTFLSGAMIAHGCENAQLLLLNSNRLVGRCLQFHKWSNKYA